jgi:general secretion pathway protein E/type IV pilus assembly protein PilB
MIPDEVRHFQPAIVSRIKILSNLDIAEKRVPQDGRIKVMVSGHQVDIRVSIIPMLHGEAVVLRLLDCSGVVFGLERIGMGSGDLKIFKDIITRPHGIILVTGPTGSGKTTTLYAALSTINDMERKIITIEDPVEYQLRGINQIQVSNKTGLTFARGLRSILRHDPDVILVGEIRDLETAEIAIQSSLTGHLVFSTLHTNDAPGALTRLVDMGVEPYLVASSLEAVIAQRLIRLVCRDCRVPVPQKETDELRRLYPDMIPERLYKGAGCKKCQGTGYYGRAGIFEQMIVSEDVRSLLVKNAGSREIRRQAAKEGMKSLRDDVCRYLAEGMTTVEEVIRVTKSNIE